MVGSAVRGDLPAAAWSGARFNRRTSWTFAGTEIAFRASPSGTCRFGVFPVGLRSRGHPHYRRNRRDGLLLAGEGHRYAYPVRRNIRVSAFDRLLVGGIHRLSWLLALRRFESHGLGGLRQSRGLPSAISIDPPRRRGELRGSPGVPWCSTG